VSEADYELLVGFTDHVQSELPLCKSMPQHSWVVDLPWKLSWAMMTFQQSNEPDWCVPYAIHVAHLILAEHSKFRRQEQELKNRRDEERTRLTLLKKIERLGPCPLRQLLRTFSVQRKELYTPVLDALISDGLILCDSGQYMLAAPTKPTQEA
jgi:hypothetical protein